jgi:hypothetical protein
MDFLQFLGKDGKAVSLKRVAELTGKDVPFEKLDIMNVEKLEELFKRVSYLKISHKFSKLSMF